VAEGGYVSRRLLQLVMPVFPERRMFRIHDPEAYADTAGAPLPPIGVLATASREQLWVGSLQQDIDVRLVLEEWDGQPLLPDAWDEEAKARLYLRGRLSVDMGSAGSAVTGLRLSGGVGNYEVRVYARYREAVVQMYADLFSQHRDPLSDEFQREKRKLEGVERYLIQLWRDSLSTRPRRRAVVGSLTLRPGRGRVRRGGYLVVAGGTDRLGRRSRLFAEGFRAVRAEGDHGVDREPDNGEQEERAERADHPAPRAPEPARGPRPPERGQLGRKPRVLGGEPPLYFREHALLVH
jgi:hypothetical protein